MLRLTNLVLARGAKRLLDGAALTVHAGHKAGVVGPNGAGKSSLFALLRGEMLPEAGTVDLPPGWTIAHVRNQPPRRNEKHVAELSSQPRSRTIMKRSASAVWKGGLKDGKGTSGLSPFTAIYFKKPIAELNL